MSPVEEGGFFRAVDEPGGMFRFLPESHPLQRQAKLTYPQAEFLPRARRHRALDPLHPQRRRGNLGDVARIFVERIDVGTAGIQRGAALVD